MADFPNGIVLEARKRGLSQVSLKEGDFYRVSFDIHPDDASSELSKMKLGTRVALVVTPLGDTEQPPAEQTERPKGTERWSEAKRKMVQRAALVCKEEPFQNYIARGYRIMWNHERHNDASFEERAAYFVRTVCGVKSRSDIEPTEESGARFREIIQKYEASQRGDTEEARLAQRDRT